MRLTYNGRAEQSLVALLVPHQTWLGGSVWSSFLWCLSGAWDDSCRAEHRLLPQCWMPPNTF